MPVVTKTRLTAEEFVKRYADLPCCELERGEVVRLMAGGWRHGRISDNIGYLLTHWARQSKRGRVLTNESGLITDRDPDTVRGADVMYFSYVRMPEGREPEDFPETPPELVVEVIGKGQGWKKMHETAGEYMRMGVDRVWIVNPQSRTTHVMYPDQDPRVLREADTLSDEDILTGFSCAVDDFFAA